MSQQCGKHGKMGQFLNMMRIFRFSLRFGRDACNLIETNLNFKRIIRYCVCVTGAHQKRRSIFIFHSYEWLWLGRKRAFRTNSATAKRFPSIFIFIVAHLDGLCHFHILSMASKPASQPSAMQTLLRGKNWSPPDREWTDRARDRERRNAEETERKGEKEAV